MGGFIRHLKKYVFRGFLSLIPLALTYFALNLLYNYVDRRVADVVDHVIGFRFPGLGVIIVAAILYFFGLIASNIVGKRLLRAAEAVTTRIPLVKTTYKVGQQLSSTLLLPERQIFTRAVLVEFLMPGIWTVGFVAGSVRDRRNADEELFKVFIPTPPNPTSGTMVLVRASQTRDPGWTIEEALNTVISGGIIGPAEIK